MSFAAKIKAQLRGSFKYLLCDARLTSAHQYHFDRNSALIRG
jgi:hypothetical protein